MKKGGDKYSLTMIFDKDADLKEMRVAVKKAAKDKWPNLFEKTKGKWPKSIKSPFLSGNEIAEKAEEEDKDASECKGKIVVRTSRDPERAGKPDVMALTKKGLEPVTERAEFYAGCYAIASYTVYAWEHDEGGKGVSVGLGNICKMKDGDPLGAEQTTGEDDFGDVKVDPALLEDDDDDGEDDLMGEFDDDEEDAA